MTRRIERIGRLYLILLLIGAVAAPLWFYGIEPMVKAWGWMS